MALASQPLQRSRRIARSACLALFLAVAPATLLGFLGETSWFFDLFSHFRVQYAFVLGIATVGALGLGAWRLAAGSAAVLLLNLLLLGPLWWSHPAPAAAGSNELRVASFNVHHDNEHFAEIARFLRDADRDVIVILECSLAMRDALARDFPEYQVVAEPRPDAFGIAVLSRLAVDSSRVVDLGHTGIPALELRVRHGGIARAILAVHTMPPLGDRLASLRDRMLRAAGDWAAAQPGSAIVLGDLNATPWSYGFRELLARGHLTSSQVGYGLQSSWPQSWWPLSVPIDHCLHDASLTTVARQVGPFLGSDHRPVLITLSPA